MDTSSTYLDMDVGDEKCAIFHFSVRWLDYANACLIYIFIVFCSIRTLLVLPAVASQCLPTRAFRKLKHSFNLTTLGSRVVMVGKKEETLHGHIMDIHIKNSP